MFVCWDLNKTKDVEATALWPVFCHNYHNIFKSMTVCFKGPTESHKNLVTEFFSGSRRVPINVSDLTTYI